MNTSDWIAISSTLIAVAAFLYSWFSNTKRYELTDQYRKNVLDWYGDATQILIKLRLSTENQTLTQDNKLDLLSALSTQIEIGRFYFPNINKGDFFGKEKPSAYQGYRHIALEFLVFSYNLFMRDDAESYLSHASELQRQFTAHVYDLLDPIGFNKKIHKYTDVVFDNRIILEEFLEKDPRSYIFYS